MKENWCIRPIRDGIPFLGVRIFRTHIRLMRRTVLKIRTLVRTLDAQLDEGIPLTNRDFGRLNSYKGVLMTCDGWNLYKTTIGRVLQRNDLLVESIMSKHSRRTAK